MAGQGFERTGNGGKAGEQPSGHQHVIRGTVRRQIGGQVFGQPERTSAPSL